MQSDQRCSTFGLVPTFDLSSSSNIISWNRIRIYLLTYRADEFIQQQLALSCILMMSLVILILQLCVMLLDSKPPLYDNLIKREAISTGLTVVMFGERLLYINWV